MKAIQTKYIGPTNTKGARIKVWAEDNQAKFASRDYDLNADVQAENVARQYAEDLGWLQNGQYDLHTGSIKTGWVHVLFHTGK